MHPQGTPSASMSHPGNPKATDKEKKTYQELVNYHALLELMYESG
jgi:hypothetical protein